MASATTSGGPWTRRPCPRYLCPTSAGQNSRQKVLPEAAQGLNARATGDRHRSAEKLCGREAGDAPWGRTSAAPVLEQSRGELAPTHSPARTTDARIQVRWACPALPRRVWSDHVTLPTATPPLARPCLPSRDAATISPLAGSDEPPHRSIRVAPEVVIPLSAKRFRPRAIS